MNLEQKVISLELAKEIKQVAEEKGVKLPRADYAWNYCLDKCNLYPHPEISRIPHPILWSQGTDAYDVAELGEILPAHFTCIKYPDTFMVGASAIYVDANFNENGITPLDMEDKSEAEARGKMLLYLLKNDLLNKN